MACWDILLENGPSGVKGHTAIMSGKGEQDRAKQYSSFDGKVAEVLIYNPIEYSANVENNI